MGSSNTRRPGGPRGRRGSRPEVRGSPPRCRRPHGAPSLRGRGRTAPHDTPAGQGGAGGAGPAGGGRRRSTCRRSRHARVRARPQGASGRTGGAPRRAGRVSSLSAHAREGTGPGRRRGAGADATRPRHPTRPRRVSERTSHPSPRPRLPPHSSCGPPVRVGT